jgi:hypothetical protein
LGPAGNREFFLWARRSQFLPTEALVGETLDAAILDAVSEVSSE